MTRLTLFLRLLPALALAACAAAAPPPTPAAPKADPLAAFETVRTVLAHPRCLNCHPGGDGPLQGDADALHAQGVVRGPDGRGVAGLACTSCHGRANLPASYGPAQPPGVSTEWRMPGPAVKMVFAGVAAKALCEQLKDPARNGGKDLAALLEHVAHDPLVLWGWAPGAGRAPVAVPHDVFTAAFTAWSQQGAPCPQ
jgi:hypothetical protein